MGVALLEITGLTPAIVAMDAVEKSADVHIPYYELNDYLGVCIRVVGSPAALQSAVATAKSIAAKMHAKCVTAIFNQPAPTAEKALNSPPEYQPLLEQPSVYYPADANPDTKEPPMAHEANYAIGLLETQGFTAVIDAIDTACKAADVEVIGKEKLGGGYITVVIKGDVAAVEAAIEAGTKRVDALGTLISAHVIPRPSKNVLSLLPG